MRFLIIIAAFLLASCTGFNIGRNTDGGKKRQFTNETLLGYTPVKHQGSSPLCWAYAMLATIETEHIQMGDSVNLSVDYVARHLLAEQARQHFLSGGYDRITLRGTAPLLLRLISEYGVMPYDSYNAQSLNYKALARRLQTMSETSHDLSQLSTRAQRLFDERIGYMPKNVYMLGAEYTPQQFAHSVYMLGEYTALTSFTHHPFDQAFAIEVPDNYSDELFYNVPIDVMMRRIEMSLRAGHPVCWEGDVSEPGFSFERGIAELPNDIPCTQLQRQKAFETRRTTDDHCMCLIGIAHDNKGRRYYIAKNSYGTKNPYGGLMYLSENYVRMKTVAVVVKNVH
ncbi:C1 family peptidase [Prevotella sp.]|uniref:C1 family peptidase n=1 Tax=Prevotella sp. TaxID=59823 RepID=UPI0025FD0278|nr:C1 family peptidase [Prevotella sp.]